MSKVDPALQAVQQAFEGQVARLEARLKGVIGVSIRHLESGDSVSVNGDELFPMASTYKVAMAGAVLARVDRGELALDRMVAISQRHLDETGPIAQSVRHPGVSLSLANLIELMLTQSNNNATDRVLELAGGPAEVTAWLRSVGVERMSVDHSVNDLLNKFFGFPAGAAASASFLQRYPTSEAAEAVSGLPNPAFDDNPQDSASPRAMVELLAVLFDGVALTSASRAFLIEVMERCETGGARLRGQLPAGVVVADKTGTIGGTINDAGMITLPGDRGRLLIAVYTKKSPILPVTSREYAIAEIARSAFDYFSIR